MTALLHLLVRQSNESDPIIVPVPVPVPVPSEHGVRHGSPVVAFIIGLSIIILASVLNAAGLNLTKLDHVCALHPYLWWYPPIDRYSSGSNQSYPKKRAEERLVTTFMAPWNVTLYVRLS